MAKPRKNLDISGANLWYLVGLITSDGNLSQDGRHIDITSKEKNFLEKLKTAIGLENKVCVKNKEKINLAYHLQIANKNFYEFLLSIGLMPNKSLILSKLNVPDKFFFDFLRGIIDGDGCIRHWVHPSNKKEQWSLRIFSGSRNFINWLKERIEICLRCRGRIHTTLNPGRQNAVYTLKYGRMAAKKISGDCYYKDAFSLERKAILARECFASSTGWSKSKTVLN